MARRCRDAGGLTCHVVPGAQPTGSLGRGPVRVDVVPYACVHAAGLAGLVLPGADGAWRRGRCPWSGVVPSRHVTAVGGGVGTVARVVRPRIAGRLGRRPVGVDVVSRAGIDAAGLPRQVVPRPRIAGDLRRRTVGAHVVARRCRRAGGLTGHVVPGAQPTGRLGRRTVGVHVVAHARVHAAGLAGLVLPGADGAWCRCRCPWSGVVPCWDIPAVRR